MKTNFTLWILCIALFLVSSPLQAQTQEASSDQPRKTGLSKVGLTLGFGTANMNLNQMNTRLQDLEIGKLEEMLSNIDISLYSEIHGGLGASFNVSIAEALESIAYDPKAFLRLSMRSYGVSLYYPLLQTDRIRLQVLGGPRFNDMRFTYNGNTNTAPDLDNLLTNPSSNSNTIVLESVSANESAVVGARFQYRLGKTKQLKQHEISIGIDSGYNFSFGEIRWREAYSKVPIQNMPTIKPDHFYLNFTFSANLLR